MFEILALTATSHGYTARSTDYPLMEMDRALELAADLTRQAIANNSDQRWTIIPAEYHGRPFNPMLGAQH